MLPVCQTWEDLLFAHVNSLVEGYYSSKLAELSRTPGGVASFPFFDSIAYHTRGRTLLDDKTVIPRIIDEISANRHIPDAGLPLRAIQGSLISSRFHDLVVELDRQLRLFEEVGPDYDCRADERSRGLDALEPRLLRVVVHMIMVLQSLDANFQVGASYHSAAENVIAGYISTLGEFGKYDLVPIYASRLSPEKAIAVVGKSLAFFHGDDSQRDALIESMDRHEIDVDGCLKTAMRQSLDMTSHEYVPSAIIEHGLIFKGFTDEIRDEDRQLIRGLEWLMLGSEALREEIVQKGCEVYKRFLRKFSDLW